MKNTYTAVLTPSETGKKYYARVPGLPGCITTGRTLSETVDEITDAASGWLTVAEDEGMPIAPPTKQKNLLHAPNAILYLITVDTTRYRSETSPVRKDREQREWRVSP